jgi:uncharacterized membrane protein
LSFCVVVNAEEDRSYFIENYQISARVNENGDMLVDETLDYVFDGSFNGIYRTLGLEKNEEYENIQVFVAENGKLTEFIKDNSQRENTYQLIKEGNLLKIKAFNKSKDQKKTLDELKSYTMTVKNATRFKESYDAWVALVNLEADRYKFFDESTVLGIVLGIISGIFGIGFGVFTLIVHGNILGFVLLLFTSVALIVYSALVKRRTKIGVEHFSKWKAFRKYLTDFSMLKEAEVPAIILWEHFLVYAISLGVAKEVIKQLNVVFRDDDFKNSSLTYMYYGYFGYNLRQMDSLDRITTSITKTTESTYTQAMSQISSKGGGGGGFSGGGGGGGGGGGAGAF